MDSWHQFLQQQGAQFDGDQLIGFDEAATTSANPRQNLLFPLEGLVGLQLHNGALEAGSHKLLQGQLTCNMDNLSATASLFGAHCTAKGRVLANFHILQDDNGVITLILPRDQLSNTTEGLKKYAPFFRVSLETSSEKLLGLAGPDAHHLCQQVMGVAPKNNGQTAHSEYGSVLCLDRNRLLLSIAPQHIQDIWKKLTTGANPAAPECWELMNIRAGIGYVRAETSEAFIPQMLNMHVSHGENGAISFKKGCYTGQEVVARMHYLGKLKRRMYRVQIPATAIVRGDHCYIPDKAQSQGDIVSIAHSGENTLEILAVLTEPAAASPTLAFGASPDDTTQQTPILKMPLPYSLDSEPNE